MDNLVANTLVFFISFLDVQLKLNIVFRMDIDIAINWLIILCSNDLGQKMIKYGMFVHAGHENIFIRCPNLVQM